MSLLLNKKILISLNEVINTFILIIFQAQIFSGLLTKVGNMFILTKVKINNLLNLTGYESYPV